MKEVVFPVDCNASNSSLLLSFFEVNNVPEVVTLDIYFVVR